MKTYTFNTFYGSYGKIVEHNDGTCNMEIIWNAYTAHKPYRKKYKTLAGCKRALSIMCDAYTIKEYKGV